MQTSLQLMPESPQCQEGSDGELGGKLCGKLGGGVNGGGLVGGVEGGVEGGKLGGGGMNAIVFKTCSICASNVACLVSSSTTFAFNI